MPGTMVRSSKKGYINKNGKWQAWPREKTYYPHGFTLLSCLQLLHYEDDL